MRQEYLQIDKIEGPLIVLENVDNASYGEIIYMKKGKKQ